MSYKPCLVAIVLLAAFSADAQSLWNTNQKWPETGGFQKVSIQNISFSKKINFLEARMGISEDSIGLNKHFDSLADAIMQKSKGLSESTEREIAVVLGRTNLLRTNNLDSATNFAKGQIVRLERIAPDNATDSANKLLDSGRTGLARALVVIDSTILKEEKRAWFEADVFARKNAATVSKFVQSISKIDTSISNKVLNLNSINQETKNETYIVLALQDTADIQRYFDSLRILQYAANDSLEIRIMMSDIISMVYKQTPPGKGKVAVFLSGDFLSTVQNNSSTSNNNSNVGTGSIGVVYTTPNQKTSFTSRIMLLSTQDTVSNNYGTQVLVPAKGKGFGTAVVGVSRKVFGDDDMVHPYAVNLFATGSTQHWRLDSMPASGASSAVDTFTQAAALLGLDLTLSKAFLMHDSISIGSSKYALSFNFNMGFAERFLGGDVLKPIQTNNSILKQTGYYSDIFPTKRNKFFGLETGSSISLGPIMAEFELYYFFPNGSKDIMPLYGLTGLQVAFGASVNLNFFHN